MTANPTVSTIIRAATATFTVRAPTTAIAWRYGTPNLESEPVHYQSEPVQYDGDPVYYTAGGG